MSEQEKHEMMPEQAAEAVSRAEEKKSEPVAGWYVVHTYSGYENKVKKDIIRQAENRNIRHLIQKVVIPVEEEVVEVKSASKKAKDDAEDKKAKKEIKTKVVKKLLIPGYVMVKMVHNDETWFVVRNTRGVTSFVGPGSEPVPLTPQEVDNMRLESIIDEDDRDSAEATALDDTPKAPVNVDYAVGDMVRVVDGAYKDMEVVVREIRLSKEIVVVGLSAFGRETPLELDLRAVKRID